jgi:capsular polysaccharide biosynthesis protein
MPGAEVEPAGPGVSGPVFVNHEALMFERGRIRPESFALALYAEHFRRPTRYVWFLFKNYCLRRGADRVDTGLWVIDNLSACSYFHWIAESLPRLLLAERSFPDVTCLLLPRSFERDPYVPFTLQAFPNVKTVKWVDDNRNARVESLAFIPRPTPSNAFVPQLVREVGARIRALVDPVEPKERIYLSRAALRRGAINEDDVVRVLRQYDFRIVHIDPTRSHEQVTLSASAKTIAGVHGAALTNIMLMPPGGHVLELRHRRQERFPDCYRPLAKACGHTYQPQLCEPVRDSMEWDVINRSDIVVDLDLLRENLDRLS